MIPPPPSVWPQPDGAPVSCREKLRMLAENHAELAQALQDAFEDAMLMGVDEQAMRRILTGMVERFWTLETEDSMAASFKTLLQTMFISLVIAFVLSRPQLVRQLFSFPETLGLVMAAQLLIGRYTGSRR